MSIIISTQAPTDANLLSVLIDDALAGHDPRVICSLYTAPPDADPFDLQTIKLANPALGNFENPEEVLAMARKLSKKRSSGRIDGMVALTMAFGVAPMRTAVRFDPEALIA